MTKHKRKMSEDEAIYCLKAGSERYPQVCEECPLYGQTGCDHCYDDANDLAIKALRQVQQYRVLGTVEQIKTLQDDYWKLNEMCKEYSALGTVEELRVAKELYDSINKIEDDICRLGMGCDDLRERIKQIYKQFRGKV